MTTAGFDAIGKTSLSGAFTVVDSFAGVTFTCSAACWPAEAAAARGDAGAAANILQAFAHEVNAQTGKAIAPADADLLLLVAGSL